jgi:hypothetical protein
VARSRSRRPPALIEFVAGYPGPPEARYHGGSVEVVAALLYKDGVRIDWRMRSVSDLSWLPIDKEEVAPRRSARLEEIPDLTEGQRALRRVSAFWEQSILFDAQGNEFQRSEYRNGMSIKGGWQGELAFFCPVQPTDTRELTLRLGDLVFVVPFDSNAARDASSEPRFVAGYAGPRVAVAFHGGAVKVIAALVYSNEVVIEWLIRPVPDLSWIPFDEEKIAQSLDKHGGKNREKLTSTLREWIRLGDLWHRAVLTDDRGTRYMPSTGSSGSLPAGHKGEHAFSPGPPADARELNLTMDELSILIPLGKK